MPTSYEDLTGGFGPVVNYRAKRVLARKFLEHQVLKLVLDKVEYDLHDISMNGVSFYASGDGEEWAANEDKFQMLLTIQDKYQTPAEPKEVYSGKAKVARIKPTSRGVRVGLELVGGFLNLPKIHWDYEERQLEQSIAQGPELIHGSVPKDYREQVEQTVHFIQFYRRMLTHHEQRYQEVGNTAAIDAMIVNTFDQLLDVWKDICKRTSALLAQYLGDRTMHRVIKEYTETMVTSRLMDCPSFRTAYTKPLGYAGDFQIMDYFYRSTFEGQSAFARVFHRLGCEDAMAAGIRHRMALIKKWTEQEYRRFVASSIGQQEFRVTSLGSGPAKEVSDFVEDQQDWKRPVKWTLIDQEERALGMAFNGIYPRIYSKHAPASLQCMYMSFTDLMRDPEATKLQEQQHFIYLSGVLDYFKKPKAMVLIRRLYEDFLAPGGMLAVGNAKTPNEHFWIAEFVVNWSLIYRTEDDMLRLADGLTCADKSVQSEEIGAYHFLVLRKP